MMHKMLQNSVFYHNVTVKHFVTEVHACIISAELPEAPGNVNIVSTNSTAVEITWHLGFNGNSPLDHILIQYSQGTHTSIIVA